MRSVRFVVKRRGYCCNHSAGVALKCAIHHERNAREEKHHTHSARKSNNRAISLGELYISLLSHFSKIFEKLVSTNLLSFLAQNSILCPQQFGFCQGLSTSLALLKLQDHILEQNSKKLFTCAIFLDLKKAFDTVDYQILLGKLSQCGLGGSTNKFFESYLSKRQQFVYANDIKSNTRYITCGVPQGSTLGPILFYCT